MNSENISTADRQQDLIQARTIRNLFSTLPPLPLPIHFGDNHRERFLFLYSERFLKLAVKPLMMLALVVPGCIVVKWGTVPWFALIASLLPVYAFVGVTWQRRHPGSLQCMCILLLSRARLHWRIPRIANYGSPARSVGLRSTALQAIPRGDGFGTDAMRRKFDHTYSIIVRRYEWTAAAATGQC